MAQPLTLELSEIVVHLAATRLFALLEPEQLALLSPAFRAVRYEPGQTVAHQGEIDATLWVVVEGQVSFDREDDEGRIEHLGFQGYGAAIGERGVFTGEPRANSAMTIERTSFLYVDAEALWSALRDQPEVFDRLVLPDAVRKQLMDEVQAVRVEGEHTVSVHRRHWLVLMRSLVLPTVSFALVAAVAVAAAPLVSSPTAVLVLALAALALPLLGAVWAFFDYRYDCLIITNRRVIHIERTPLIDARRSEAPLTRVQDIQVVTPSLSARMLGLGHITVQTAGSRRTIHFDHIADPEAVRETIFEQVERAHTSERRERVSWIADHLEKALGGSTQEDGAPSAAPTHETERDDEGDVGFDDPTLSPSGLLHLPVQLVSALLPKMRVQDGATVTWRKHWWILLRRTWWLLALLLIIVGAVVAIAVQSVAWPWEWLLVAALGVIAILWWRFEDWRNDLYQLTDEHIVDIERLPLGFFEDRRQSGLDQIQDITYVVPNPVATFFNFGSVVIETAADTGNFTFDHVYSPSSVQEEIFARLEQRKARVQRDSEQQRAEEMTRWLMQYHRLTGGAGTPGDRIVTPPAPSQAG